MFICIDMPWWPLVPMRNGPLSPFCASAPCPNVLMRLLGLSFSVSESHTHTRTFFRHALNQNLPSTVNHLPYRKRAKNAKSIKIIYTYLHCQKTQNRKIKIQNWESKIRTQNSKSEVQNQKSKPLSGFGILMDFVWLTGPDAMGTHETPRKRYAPRWEEGTAAFPLK